MRWTGLLIIGAVGFLSTGCDMDTPTKVTYKGRSYHATYKSNPWADEPGKFYQVYVDGRWVACGHSCDAELRDIEARGGDMTPRYPPDEEATTTQPAPDIDSGDTGQPM